jgi:hypothetical protein
MRASKVIPTRRKGSESSHTKGKIIKARSANGHETNKRRHQTRRASRVFTQLAFHSLIKRQPGTARVAKKSLILAGRQPGIAFSTVVKKGQRFPSIDSLMHIVQITL